LDPTDSVKFNSFLSGVYNVDFNDSEATDTLSFGQLVRRQLSATALFALRSCELAVKEPDLMRLVLQARVAALVNVQALEAGDAELKRRAVNAN